MLSSSSDTISSVPNLILRRIPKSISYPQYLQTVNQYKQQFDVLQQQYQSLQSKYQSLHIQYQSIQQNKQQLIQNQYQMQNKYEFIIKKLNEKYETISKE